MPTIDMTATGQKIRELRMAAKMTIGDVQQATGVSAAAVTRWQRGSTLPSIDNMVILAAIWHVKIDEIIVTV